MKSVGSAVGCGGGPCGSVTVGRSWQPRFRPRASPKTVELSCPSRRACFSPWGGLVHPVHLLVPSPGSKSEARISHTLTLSPGEAAIPPTQLLRIGGSLTRSHSFTRPEPRLRDHTPWLLATPCAVCTQSRPSPSFPDPQRHPSPTPTTSSVH